MIAPAATHSLLIAAALCASFLSGPTTPGDANPAAATAYCAPAEPVIVVNAYDAPADPYAAGHRGADLALSIGAPVSAAGSGTVSFAGPVAGRGLVVIVHPDGISTEYEPLTVTVRVGQHVLAGQSIGTLAASHPGCERSCVHWGARRNGIYFDPMSLLRALGIVRLLPLTP